MTTPPLIDPKTRAISLRPFLYMGSRLRVTGTFRDASGKWFHSVKNEDTGEFKNKEHGWIESVNGKLKQERG